MYIPDAFRETRAEVLHAHIRAHPLATLVLHTGAVIGKWKVSQNRPRADARGVVSGLQSRGDAESLAMADLVAERLGRGDDDD